MKRKKEIKSDRGRIDLELTPDKKAVYIELDEESCKFLMQELNRLYNDKEEIIEYEARTGFAIGVLTENSLGFILRRRDN